MKMRIAHLVPLSRQVLELLEELRALTDDFYFRLFGAGTAACRRIRSTPRSVGSASTSLVKKRTALEVRDNKQIDIASEAQSVFRVRAEEYDALWCEGDNQALESALDERRQLEAHKLGNLITKY